MDTQWSNVSLSSFIKLQGTVSFAETAIAYPLDVLKTRQQAISSPQWAKSSASLASATARNFGVREFFHGFRFAVVGGIPSEIGYYMMYNEVKNWYGDHMLGYLIAGGAAEISILALWVPMDVISQRQQLENIKHRYHWWPRSSTTRPGPIYHRIWYGTHGHLHAGVESSGLRMWSHMQKEWLDTNVPITARNGWRWQLYQIESYIRPVYRGTLVTAGLQVPQSATYWATYELSKIYSSLLFGPTYFASGMAGFVAGAFSAAVTTPLDVIKTRHQAIPNSTLQETLLKTTLNRSPSESIFAPFFRGVSFRVISVAPRSALSFVCYEAAMYYSQKSG